MLYRTAAAACFSCALISGAAYGVHVDIDFSMPMESIGEFGDPANTTLSVPLTTGSTPALIRAVGWDMTLETMGGSLASEASIAFADGMGSPGPGAPVDLFLTPGAGDDVPRPAPGMSYSSGGLIELPDITPPVPDILLSNGVLQLEFFEQVDTAPGADAVWNSTISVEFFEIPGPSSLWVAVVGITFCGGRRRR